MNILIRKAVEEDTGKVFPLMQELAIFERYIDSFAITPAIVKEKGFQKSPPDFLCLVAEDQQSGKIAGMLVYYFIPYTAQNRPFIFMKELYVEEVYRSKGIGGLLMNALQEEAKAHNCKQIKWSVAPWNEAGIRFYEKLGARENRDWLQFELEV